MAGRAARPTAGAEVYCTTAFQPVGIFFVLLLFVCHPERSRGHPERSRGHPERSRGISAKRFILLVRPGNRFALIPPLRSLTLAPVGMTQGTLFQ
jgi:hypothetical protein